MPLSWTKRTLGLIVGLTAVALMIGLIPQHKAPAQPPASFDGAAPPQLDRPIDWSCDVTTFNCAGFAFRNYRWVTLDDVHATFATLRELKSTDEPCPPGWVRIWSWEYDSRKETEDGLAQPTHRDGHMVAGITDAKGAGPELVFCKYAKGAIEMPQPPESWRPPEREFFGTNTFGQKVFTVRSNYTVRWYTAPADVLAR